MADDQKLSFLRVHRAILLVSALLIASIAVSIYFGSLKPRATRATVVSDLLEFSIELNKTEFVQQGEAVNVTFSLINTGNKTITIRWSSFYLAFSQTLYFDFYIIDGDGTRIYQWSHGHGALMAIKNVVVNPGERVTNFYKWPQVYSGLIGYDAIVPKGTYSVVGLTRGITLKADSQTGVALETPSITFTIR